MPARVLKSNKEKAFVRSKMHSPELHGNFVQGSAVLSAALQ
jgi:hypothetical protein